MLDISATRRAVLDVKSRDYNPVAFKKNNDVYQLIKKEHKLYIWEKLWRSFLVVIFCLEILLLFFQFF